METLSSESISIQGIKDITVKLRIVICTQDKFIHSVISQGQKYFLNYSSNSHVEVNAAGHVFIYSTTVPCLLSI